MATSPQMFKYTLFGLNLHSAVPLPELPVAMPDSAPDMTIDHGDVPGEIEGDGRPQPIDGGAMFAIEGIARYAILGGTRIVIEPAPGAAERNIRLYLLGSAMGMLLHQRGLLPLHANAVEIDGKAVAFMGPSGAGKSTLAAWFHDRGYRVIADDVCVVRFDGEGQPNLSPGLQRLRLWKDAIEATGRETSRYDRSYVGDEDWDKFDVPLAQRSGAAEATPLAAIYLLATKQAFGISRLDGMMAADAVFANTYRGQYVAMAQSARTHWASCAKLIAGTPIFLAERQWGLPMLDVENSRILDHARDIAVNGTAKLKGSL